MVLQSNLEYFRSRAVIERERAKAARTPEIARIHEELAHGYEVLVQQEQERPIWRSSTPSRSLREKFSSERINSLP